MALSYHEPWSSHLAIEDLTPYGKPFPERLYRLRRLPSCDQCCFKWGKAGFFHASGLGVHNHDGNLLFYVGQNLTTEEFGKWDSKNGVIVFVTLRGEVWMSSTTRLQAPTKTPESWAAQFSPNGRGCFIPLANRRHRLLGMEFEERLTNPYHLIICLHGQKPLDCNKCNEGFAPRCKHHGPSRS